MPMCMGMNEGKLIGDPSLSINLNGASVSVCLIETLDLSRILNFLVDLAGRVSLMAFTHWPLWKSHWHLNGE